MHRYRKFKKSKAEERADRIEQLAAKINLTIAALTGDQWVHLLAADSSRPIPMQPFEPVPTRDVCYPTIVAAKLAIANELATSACRTPAKRVQKSRFVGKERRKIRPHNPDNGKHGMWLVSGIRHTCVVNGAGTTRDALDKAITRLLGVLHRGIPGNNIQIWCPHVGTGEAQQGGACLARYPSGRRAFNLLEPHGLMLSPSWTVATRILPRDFPVLYDGPILLLPGHCLDGLQCIQIWAFSSFPDIHREP